VVADNILKVAVKPAKEHEDNMFKVPAKALNKDDQEDDFLSAPKKKEEKETKTEPEPVQEEAPPAAPAVDTEELLAEFASGKMLGDDLKKWVEEKRAVLPTLDKIVCRLLTEREKLNPDPNCPWAEANQFGAALLSLVQDDIVAQMHVLWGIQFYCDKLGFPKLNEEYVVQGMFRAMYKYDLVESDAFVEWKDDETEAFELGKIKAVIQTVDWFNWLEEDEEEDEVEEEE
jgi:hypothetical protein